MRRIFYTGLVAVLLLAACKKDSSTVTPTNQNATYQKGTEYRLVSFNGKSGINQDGTYVRLSWSAENENKMQRYVLERATSGDNWHTITENRCSTKPGIVGTNYSDERLQVRPNDDYRYRVRVFDVNGNTISSSPLRVKFAAQAGE